MSVLAHSFANRLAFAMASPADVLRFAHFEAAVQNAQRRANESDRIARHLNNQCRMANAQADYARGEMWYADGRAHGLEEELESQTGALEQALHCNLQIRDEKRKCLNLIEKHRSEFKHLHEQMDELHRQFGSRNAELQRELADAKAENKRLRVLLESWRELADAKAENKRLREQLESERPAKRARKLK